MKLYFLKYLKNILFFSNSETHLSELRRFAASRFPDDDHHLVLPDDGQQFLLHRVYGQELPLLLHRLALAEVAAALLLLHVPGELLVRFVAPLHFRFFLRILLIYN